MASPLSSTDLMSDPEILEKFYLLHTTIGLTKTRFGYVACGAPGIIAAIEKGRKVHDRTRRQIGEMLRYVEAAHTDPIPPELRAKLDLMGVKIPEAVTVVPGGSMED